MRRHAVVLGAALLAAAAAGAVARPAAAQAVKFGTLAGALRLPVGMTEGSAGAVLELQPLPWLTLGTHPTWVRVSGSDALGSFSTSGLTDLPVEAGGWFDLPGPLSPGLGVSFGVTFPTGDTARGLGSGVFSYGASVGASISPAAHWFLSADVWRPLSGAGWATALSSSQATSLSVETGYDLGGRRNAHLGVSTDLGASDSTGAVRSLTGGLTLPLTGPLAFTVDATRGITSGAPPWGFSLGIGSAFEGISPLGIGSPMRRLASAFGRGVNRGNGYGRLTHGRSGR